MKKKHVEVKVSDSLNMNTSKKYLYLKKGSFPKLAYSEQNHVKGVTSCPDR